MKNITMLAVVDENVCTGCKICEKVCPVLTIKVVDRKAKVDNDACTGCCNCEQRCPFYAIKMVKRDEPIQIGVDVSKYDQEEIREMCEKAHLNPQQTLCYCVGVRAEEVAAALISGAKTPEEVSAMTGMRTGCTIECIQPLLRMVEAAGNELVPIKGGWQWYGTTATAWTIPDKVKEKYGSRGFYFEEDRILLDEIVHTKNS
ncbi:4Fe-4S binding protein [Youngiibacter fragilis]|uniref:(Fe-S)-binding protein n=1 Tax=Youngiibacter fragilis 232.1 TaxID=994573 RepID=V7I9T1_9CLOT|nr:4Fe-4S binding protein [Youngiibacter fragilis]ETA81597.1 (Fe-S)-binding protein [Youngiibacter fragilis 232.1]